jgi:hypothetical protein
MAYRIELNDSNVKFEDSKIIEETLGVLDTKGRLYPFKIIYDNKDVVLEWLGVAPLSRKDYQQQIIKQFKISKNYE